MQGKCEYKKCNHEDTHKEGHCWAITEKDLENLQTDEKYCPCGVDLSVRIFETLGYMIPRMEDYMVTKKCTGCGDIVLLLLTETVCEHCKILP